MTTDMNRHEPPALPREHAAVQACFNRSRARARGRLLAGRCPEDGRILDVGCGEGDWLAAFMDLGLPAIGLTGVDRDAERVSRTSMRLPEADIRQGLATSLPFADSEFSGVCLSLVLSSLRSGSERKSALAECWRVLAPGGWLLVHDLRIGKPGGRAHAVPRRTCEDLLPVRPARSEAVSLTLLPPLVRLLAPRWSSAVSWLERLPFLRGHWMARFDKEAVE